MNRFLKALTERLSVRTKILTKENQLLMLKRSSMMLAFACALDYAFPTSAKTAEVGFGRPNILPAQQRQNFRVGAFFVFARDVAERFSVMVSCVGRRSRLPFSGDDGRPTLHSSSPFAWSPLVMSVLLKFTGEML